MPLHHWKANRAVPSENTLADEDGLSRLTVRRAIAVLTEEGHLYAVAGRDVQRDFR